MLKEEEQDMSDSNSSSDPFEYPAWSRYSDEANDVGPGPGEHEQEVQEEHPGRGMSKDVLLSTLRLMEHHRRLFWIGSKLTGPR